MKRAIARRALALVFAFLLVTSIPFAAVELAGPDVSPVVTATASHGGTDVDDFEDGNKNIEVSGWSGWDESSGTISVQSNNVISGDNSAQLSPSDSNDRVKAFPDSSQDTPTRIGVKLNISKDTGNTGDAVRVQLLTSGPSNIMTVEFEMGSQEIKTVSGTNTGMQWRTDVVYKVEFRDIDYSSNTYDIYINGEQLLDDEPFDTNANSVDELWVHARTSTSNGNTDVFFDDVEADGSAYSIDEFGGGVLDDFEDNDRDVDATGWSGHAAEGTGGSFGIESSTPIEGTHSGNISVSDGNMRSMLFSESGFYSHEEISLKLNISQDVGNNNDGVHFQIRNTTDVIFQVEFVDGSGNIEVNGGTSTGETWSPKEVITVEFKDISWEADTFDLWINDSKALDDQSFQNPDPNDGYDVIWVRSDTGASTSSRTVIYDQMTLSSGGNTVSGTVENQNGDPVSNATVQVWGVDYDQITGDKDEALDEIEAAANKTPTEWVDQLESDFTLTGPGNHFNRNDVTYAAVHALGDWKIAETTDQVRGDPTLDPDSGTGPILELDASRGETVTVAVSAWDSDKFGLRNTISSVKNDLPGEPIEASIVIETLLAPDDTVETTQTTKTQIDCNFIGCDWSSAFVEVQLTPGFYRVYVEGHESESYVIKVGDPIDIIAVDLEKESGQVADQAADVAQDLTDGVFTKTTTTTGSDGSWSVDVGSSVNTVAVQAYKAPDVSVNDTDLTYADIITEYEESYDDGERLTRLGSIYLPSEVKNVDPPESNVTVTVHETTFPELASRDDLEDLIQDILDEMLNESLADTLGPYQNETEDIARSELESTYETLVDMYQNNPTLRAIVDELAENSGRELVIRENLDDVTDSEMQDTVDLIYEGLSLLGSGSGSGVGGGDGSSDIDEDIGNDTISQIWTLPGDIDDTSITLLIHWSNGTTNSLSTESDHLSIEKRAGQRDQVILDEHPIGDEDPSSLTFELLYVTDDGVPGRDRNTIRNPRFDGDVPSLDAIELTSLEPGPADQVDIEIHPEDAAQFGSIVSTTVTGPGGSDISTDAVSSEGRETGFKTDGAGIYHVSITFNNSDGDEFTETLRVSADEFDDDRPPSAQIRSGPTGRYLVVGDGLESGTVDVADDGHISIAAQISQDADSPGSIQLYVQDVDTGSRTEVTVRIVRGSTESRVSARVGVILHMNTVSENAVLYREESEPLPRDGANEAGEVDPRDNGTTIQSYTEADGKVTVLVENDPGLVQRFLYRVRSIGLPGTTVTPFAELSELFATSLVDITGFLDDYRVPQFDGVFP